MQPAVVAHTLQKVMDEWKAQATLFDGCNSQEMKESSLVNCKDAPSAFGKSCDIVLGAVVQGSNGNKRTAHEYMKDVCGQSIIIGWQKQQCKALALALDNAMTADAYENRWGVKNKAACESMWSHIMKEQEKNVADKKVAREALERKVEETEKFAREAAQKEASAQAARKKLDELALEKAEAQAAARKMAEAQVVAKAAQKKAAEVVQAEREQAEASTKVKQIQPKVIVAAAPSKIESVPAAVNAKVAPVESEPTQTKASVRAKAGSVLLQAEMQPEMVAQTLKNVEGEWRAQVVLFARCDPKKKEARTLVNCQDAPASFGKSCGIVVGAIVQGSNGDNTVIQEYMSSVCSQSIITGWRQKQCQSLALALNNAMTGDFYENRNNFQSQKVCDSMWSRLLQEELSSAATEKVAREVEAKKTAEAYKSSQEKKAVARARGVAENAAAEAEQQNLDEDARQKADAQAKAKAAADLVAQAETFAKAAKQKAAEAAQAERQRKELMAKVASAPKVSSSQPKVAPAHITVVQPTKLTVSPHHVMPEPKLPRKRPPLAPRVSAAEAIIATRGNSVTPKPKLSTKAVTPTKAQEMKVTEHAQEKAAAPAKKQEVAALQESPKQVVHSWQRIAALISLASQQKGA